tara:strand:- start:2110 stop:2430 length:321 start_codon:yes stop_codon:yes gene_type:complete
MKMLDITVMVICIYLIINALFSKPIQYVEMTKIYACSSHSYVTNDLKKIGKKERIAWAVSDSDELIEIFLNTKSQKWTIIFSNRFGMTCGLVSGSQGLYGDKLWQR